MILQIQCPIQGTITTDITLPHYFYKEHKPFTDENEVFSYIAGVVSETGCFTITKSYDEHGQDCTVMALEGYDSIAESKARHYCNPLYQSSREVFNREMERAEQWFNMQRQILTILKVLPPQ